MPYTIRRSARRRKTVTLSIDSEGGVLLAAPADFPTAELDAMVRRKAPWIEKQIRRVKALGPPPTPREFVSGESVLYLGRHYRLKVCPHGDGPAKLHGRWLQVPADAGESQPDQVRAALSAWLRLRAEQRLPERVDAWRRKVGVPIPRVPVANQRRRWGSCDGRGTIRLNWRIVQAPCGWWTTWSSTSWRTCCTAATGATTGRPFGASCPTTTSDIRISRSLATVSSGRRAGLHGPGSAATVRRAQAAGRAGHSRDAVNDGGETRVQRQPALG